MSGFALPLAFPLGGPVVTGVRRTDVIEVEIVGRLETLQLWASFDGGEDWEPLILDGEMDERARYGGASRALVGGIYRWQMRRMGGWPSSNVLFDDFGIALTGGATPGSEGPEIEFFPEPGTKPAAGETLDRDAAVVVQFQPGDWTLLEESMCVWVSFDGGNRWEAAVKKGELVDVYAEAGSVKAVGSYLGGSIGWTFTLRRFGGLYSALRSSGFVLRAFACDEHGLVDGEVAA